MKTVVYVDVLLGVNLLLAWFLLRATARITSSTASPLRLAAASGVAALFTLTLLAPPMGMAMQLLVKLGGSVCIAAVAFPHTGPRALLRRAVWYFLLNLLLAGMVLCAVWFGGVAGVETNNLSVYFDISPPVLVLSVLAVWLFMRLVELLFTPVQTAPVEMQLEMEDRRISLFALGDTGCHVKDPLTGQGVVLVSLKGTEEQLPPRVRQAASGFYAGDLPDAQTGLRLISCQTAAGTTLLPAFSAKNLRLRQGRRTAKAARATVGITREPFEPGGQPALVGADWLERMG